MDILVRLYVRHDADLLNLYRNKNFCLASAMRDSILAYVRNEPVKYVMPAPYIETKEDIRNASLHLYFHPEEDEDIIKFLLGVREGARCAVIKNIFRGYMMYPNIYCSFENKVGAMQHAMAVFGNTNQKVCTTGQDFVRGRGNRGRRKDRDEYGKIIPKEMVSEEISDKESVVEEVTKKEIKEETEVTSVLKKDNILKNETSTTMNFGEIGSETEQQGVSDTDSEEDIVVDNDALMMELMSMTENN